MLRITIPARDSIELWDEKNQRFLSKPPIKETTLQLEHSLVSVSKWEQKWHKPFLSDKSKTDEEVKDYVRCMTLTQNVDPAVYDYLTSENYNDIDAYIENPMTATWFSESKKKGAIEHEEVITNEIVYYWMISYGIPFECQKWHFNHLLTLIKVCGVKNEPPEKMSKEEIMARNARLNAERRARMNTKG